MATYYGFGAGPIIDLRPTTLRRSRLAAVAAGASGKPRPSATKKRRRR